MRGLLFALVFAISGVVSVSAQFATAQDSPEKAPRILAIGDSLMAWHMAGGRSIADAVSNSLNEPVINHAISGAFMVYDLPFMGALGLRISAQFRQAKSGEFDWVLITGGGNDLWLGCGCNRCDKRMRRMISSDGMSGKIPTFIDRVRATGAKVIYLGYLRSPGFGSAIEACRDEGDEFESRIELMTKSKSDVYFLSNADLVPFGDTSFHALDRIHPSVKGSAAIGERAAELIRKLDKTR